MVNNLGLTTHFKLDIAKFGHFLVALHEAYIPTVPYHNFNHAIDVTQTSFALMKAIGAAKYLKKIEQLALIVGSMCHDMGHPGQNNAYQVMAQTGVAILYNDKSVLENYHASRSFALMSEPEH